MEDSEDRSFTEPLLNPSSTTSTGVAERRSGYLTVREGRYSYAYGPQGYAGLLHNSYALGCAVFASIGGLTFGYDQGVIANILVMKAFLERWPITPWQKGVMTAALELGSLFGALVAGVLADRYSRRHSIFLACIVFCIGSALQAAAESLEMLTVGRAIGGLGVGALSMLSPLYMAEISPPELRGSLMALEQFSIVLGVVLGFWLGFATRSIPGSASWRIPLGVQLLPGILLAVGCFFLPPSPRLLVMQGRVEEAATALARLRLRRPSGADADPLLKLELMEMQVETELVRRTRTASAKSARPSEMASWMALFGPGLRARTAIAVMVMFFQQWSGINALLYYGPTLVQSIGLKGDEVGLIVSGGIGIVQFLAVVPAILYIDRLGRKPLLRGGSAVMALSHLVIALMVYEFQDSFATYPAAAWTCVAFVYVFTAAYGTSFGPVAWVLPGEVFPVSSRARGVSLATASNWINNFLIGLVTPVLMDMSAPATFGLFASACFAAYLWSTYVVPETGGVPLEDMDSVFKSGAGAKDAGLRREIEEELGWWNLIGEHAESQDD